MAADSDHDDSPESTSPVSAKSSQTVAMPADLLKYALVAVVSLLLGGGTTGLVQFASSGDVEDLKDDVANLEQKIDAQNRDLSEKIDQLALQVRGDLWTRTDQRDWVRQDYKPWQVEIEKRLRALE